MPIRGLLGSEMKRQKQGRVLTGWEIDALAMALLREVWARTVRWTVFGVVAFVVMWVVMGVGILVALQQAGGV